MLLLFLSRRFHFIFLICFAVAFSVNGQVILSNVSITTDTSTTTLLKNSFRYGTEKLTLMPYTNDNQEVNLVVSTNAGFPAQYLTLLSSKDFQIIDSLAAFSINTAKAKIRCNNVSNITTISLRFQYEDTSGQLTEEVMLLPTASTKISLRLKDEDLYQGEPRIIELTGSNLSSLKLLPEWQTTGNFDYKIVYDDRLYKLILVPKDAGKQNLRLILKTKRPFPDSGRLIDVLPTISHTFNIKTGRLAFLNVDKKEVTLETDFGKGLDLQIDYNRNLVMRKTYRIENQMEAGGAFIGEIFTRSATSNDKVLCYFRPYALHKISEGYLYLKDNDESKFVTNFVISPKPSITRISILREGAEYSSSLTVNPGDNIELKIEGTALGRVNFGIEDLVGIKKDSILSNDNVQIIRVRVPFNVTKRKLLIYQGNEKNTGYEITIKEFQEPHDLNFVTLRLNDKVTPIQDVPKVYLFDKTIQDLSIGFKPDLIDANGKLFGKQVLTIVVNVLNPKNEIVESRTIDNITVCPAENSARFAFYNTKDCSRGEINLNDALSRKTFNLPDWSQIEITVKHQQSAYNTVGYQRKVTLVLQKHTTFDVDVSLPAGLLVKKVGDNNFGSFSGISVAIMGQLSFYKPEKIQQYRPYKIGAGILALNSFNFSSDATNRDVGVVVLGSIFPTKSNAKFSFPLYAGFGFFVKENRWFYILGPGIQLRL